MAQNVNPWNNQNGIPTVQPNNTGSPVSGNVMYPMNGQNGNMMNYPNGGNNWMVQQSMPTQLNQQPTTMDQQGWKMYTPTPNRPLVGRWVNNFDDIKPKDVPMDGSFAIFPQTDQYGNMSCIYAMIWGSDGTIKPYRFLPEMITVDQSTNPEPVSDPVKEVLANFTSTMTDRMDALERRIGDILSPFTVSQQNVKNGTNKKPVVKESDAT